MRRLLFLGLLALGGCVTRSECSRSWLFSSSDCCSSTPLLDALLARKEQPEPPPPPVRQLAAAGASPVYRSPRTGRMHTRVSFPGGHLQLTGLPEKWREEVVLAFRPLATLDEECALRLYRDGEPLTTGEHVRRTHHELLVTLRIDELGASQRFAGQACGRSFELDAAGRDTIATFVARFHERVQELSAPPSSTVAAAP
jgi:hypothetical protein